MRQRPLRIAVLALALFGLVYLATRDYAQRIETDVSSLIPDDQSVETQIFRNLVSERQGRVVYVVIDSVEDGEAQVASLLESWASSSLTHSAERLDGGFSRSFLRFAGERRFELLFPAWLAEKRADFLASGEANDSFEDWLADSVLEDLEVFFESPAAMELARGELLDPLLLVIRPLLRLSEGEAVDAVESRALVWVELAESALLPETQEGLARVFDEARVELRQSFPDATLEYAGLVKLAAASRARIHEDIGKLNGLSFLLVATVSLILARPPWRLLYALPVAACSLLGALAGSLLAFDRIHIVVILIGSVLIGTSVDYAFHSLFAEDKKEGRSTRALLLIACGSTVIGFAVLLSAELALIRQIGAFVAFGLASAYLVALCLPRSEGAEGPATFLAKFRPARKLSIGLLCLFGLAVTWSAVSLPDFVWEEDVRNLEAPDPAAVEADLATREAFGVQSGGEALFSLGSDYLAALDAQSRFLRRLEEQSPDARIEFAPSVLLPSESAVEALLAERKEIPAWLGAIEEKLEQEGYESARFKSFFESGYEFLDTVTRDRIESSTEEMVGLMGGPMSLLFGKNDERAWVVSQVSRADESLGAILGDSSETLRLSQLAHLNESLSRLRSRIAFFGTIALVAVFAVVIFLMGPRHGFRVVAVPAAAVAISLWICDLALSPLTLFHLIGCLLGAAIALDYSLFSMEAMRYGRAIPFSVWLSASTTGASFFVLTLSYIAGVRDLGAMVALVTLTSLLILLACAGLAKPEEAP